MGDRQTPIRVTIELIEKYICEYAEVRLKTRRPEGEKER